MPTSFIELVTRLGAYTPASSALDHAYRVAELDEGDSPHGWPWHTSFHASDLPPDLDRACTRRMVLGLMGLPDTDVPDPEGRAIMDAGKDIERQIVRRYHRAGMLLSAPPDEPIQTGFALASHWLTTSVDAVVLLPGWNRGHVVEVKGKDNERDAFNKLAKGEVLPEPEYVAQLQCEINMANIASPAMWPDLEPVETGSLLFVNRARPGRRLEFVYEMDRPWFDRLLDRLLQARAGFQTGFLPEHPFDGKGWSEEPCAWCPYKKHYCKPAWKRELTRLEQVAEMVTETGMEYDYNERRTAVLMRWAD